MPQMTRYMDAFTCVDGRVVATVSGRFLMLGTSPLWCASGATLAARYEQFSILGEKRERTLTHRWIWSVVVQKLIRLTLIPLSRVQALEELRDSLREENTVARERQVARPSTNVRNVHPLIIGGVPMLCCRLTQSITTFVENVKNVWPPYCSVSHVSPLNLNLWFVLHITVHLPRRPLSDPLGKSYIVLDPQCGPTSGRGALRTYIQTPYSTVEFATRSFCCIPCLLSWAPSKTDMALTCHPVHRRALKYLNQAEAKPTSGSGQTARGAKGAKGSRNAAAAAGGSSGASPTAAVAKGTFSVQASANAKTSRRSSGFKMADAKALTRALAKGACACATRQRAGGLVGCGPVGQELTPCAVRLSCCVWVFFRETRATSVSWSYEGGGCSSDTDVPSLHIISTNQNHKHCFQAAKNVTPGASCAWLKNCGAQPLLSLAKDAVSERNVSFSTCFVSCGLITLHRWIMPYVCNILRSPSFTIFMGDSSSPLISRHSDTARAFCGTQQRTLTLSLASQETHAPRACWPSARPPGSRWSRSGCSTRHPSCR